MTITEGQSVAIDVTAGIGPDEILDSNKTPIGDSFGSSMLTDTFTVVSYDEDEDKWLVRDELGDEYYMDEGILGDPDQVMNTKEWAEAVGSQEGDIFADGREATQDGRKVVGVTDIYVTTDGQAFEYEDAATDHAAELLGLDPEEMTSEEAAQVYNEYTKDEGFYVVSSGDVYMDFDDALQAHMDAEGFFPNVWYDDHTLYSLDPPGNPPLEE